MGLCRTATDADDCFLMMMIDCENPDKLVKTVSVFFGASQAPVLSTRWYQAELSMCWVDVVLMMLLDILRHHLW